MNPETLKNILFKEIDSLDVKACSRRPGSDFTRSRKLPFKTLVKSIIQLEGKSLGNELLNIFPDPKYTPSVSAFVQQRQKLSPATFETLFSSFVRAVESIMPVNKYQGYRLLAVDGSDIHIPTDHTHTASFYPGTNGQSPYNTLHMNALYDLLSNTYLDCILQGSRESNEQAAFCDMVDRSWLNSVIVMADRGYESYNNIAHVTEKGWRFVIRIKDNPKANGILKGLDIPDTPEFDLQINLNCTRKQTNEAKILFKDRNRYRLIPSHVRFDYLPDNHRKSDPLIWYPLSFRIVRFHLCDDLYEAVITNLPKDRFPPDVLKKLYSMRWGIETSFRSLKYTIGLLYFHTKKAEYISQEVFAKLIMYNFSELITSRMVIQKNGRKFDYRTNFSRVVMILRKFLLGDISPPDLEAHITKNIVPVRPDRKRKREVHTNTYISFTYRIS